MIEVLHKLNKNRDTDLLLLCMGNAKLRCCCEVVNYEPEV